MITNLDILRSARVLIREHGDAAGEVAEKKAAAFRNRGVPDKENPWCRIVEDVRGLSSGRVVPFKSETRLKPGRINT